MDASVIVSIVIPTYNSLNKLILALQSIEQINFPVEKFEVIVVDDGSSDGTETYIIEIFNNKSINLSYFYQENKGPASARNLGIRQAKGEYILSIDSDCLVDKNILKRYLEHYPDEKLGGVGGKVLLDSKNMISKYLDYMGVWRPGCINSEISYLVTANAFFLKKSIINAGYFDEDFLLPGGEEPELCHRIIEKGYNFKYDEGAIVVHCHRTTIINMMKMFSNYGKGHAIFVNKCPDKQPWLVSWLYIIIGYDSCKRLKADFFKNLGSCEALIFFVLDYLQTISYYYGYRSVQSNL